MPTFRVNEEFSGRIYGWADLNRYDLVKTDEDNWTLVYAADDYDPEERAFAVDVSLSDGRVRSLVWRDEAGRELAELTGLNVPAGRFDDFTVFDNSNGNDFYSLLTKDGTTFIGGRTADDDFDNHDDITTSIGDDVVRLRGGNDYLKDLGGADRYDGGGGFDVLTYQEWYWEQPDRAERGIVVDMAAGTVVGPYRETDTIKKVEGVSGSFLDDTFNGDGENNWFQGQQGADRIDGKGGSDFANYGNDSAQGGQGGILVRLDESYAIDGWGDKDKLRSIEGVGGSDRDDTFHDSGGSNYFNGEEGDDAFYLGRGSDFVDGRDGADTFVFRGTDFGDDGIGDFDGEAGDRIRIEAADALGDLSIRIEDGDTIIALNGGAEVRLEEYTGPVDPYLEF